MKLVSVSITGPDANWLAQHARHLIEHRLAACGNIIPTVRSIYRWDNQIEDEPEAYLILHTRAEHVDAIIKRTNADHPYDTVQILATEIAQADPNYHQWVIDVTASNA